MWAALWPPSSFYICCDFILEQRGLDTFRFHRKKNQNEYSTNTPPPPNVVFCIPVTRHFVLGSFGLMCLFGILRKGYKLGEQLTLPPAQAFCEEGPSCTTHKSLISKYMFGVREEQFFRGWLSPEVFLAGASVRHTKAAAATCQVTLDIWGRSE